MFPRLAYVTMHTSPVSGRVFKLAENCVQSDKEMRANGHTKTEPE